MFRATFVSLTLLSLLAQGVNLETDTQLEVVSEPYSADFAEIESDDDTFAEVETQQGGSWADKVKGGGSSSSGGSASAGGAGGGGGKKYTGPPLTAAPTPKKTFINGHGMTSDDIVSDI